MRALVGVLLTGVALAGCSRAPEKVVVPGPDGSIRPLSLDHPCPAAERFDLDRTVRASDLNGIMSRIDLDQWQAADIGASARLSDGRVLWVYADTVRTTSYVPRIVANSMLVTTGPCVSQVVTDLGGAIIPDRKDGVVHWPMSVVAVPRKGGDDLVVSLSRVRRDGEGVLRFTHLGSSVARFTVPRGGVPRLVSVQDVDRDSASPHRPSWGAALLRQGAWVYAFGSWLRPHETFGRAVAVARFPAGSHGDPAAWRYWDGAAWSLDPDSAVEVIPAKGGVSQTLSAHVIGGRVVLLSKKDGDLGGDIAIWRAPTPTGPFETRTALKATFSDGGGGLQYAPLAHPGLPSAAGRLIVSVSRNTKDPARLLADPTLGRPVFTEVARP